MTDRKGMRIDEEKTMIGRRSVSRVVALAAAAALALAAMAAPAAQARPEYPFMSNDPAPGLPTVPNPPKFNVTASTAQAGAHPDLTVEMHKLRSHCPGWLDNPAVNQCLPDEMYMEQDLKRMFLRLPPGIAADANAAPYCDAFQDWVTTYEESPYAPGVQQFVWQCRNPDSVVGSIRLVVAQCDPIPDGYGRSYCVITQDADQTVTPGAAADRLGFVYNERPGPGEQGHLIVLWWAGRGAEGEDRPDVFRNVVRSDIVVKVRPSDAGIDSIADDIPDARVTTGRLVHGGQPGPTTTSFIMAQLSDLELTLFGSKGLERGHPLLTNPTSCEPQAVDAELQGWLWNSIDDQPSNPRPGSSSPLGLPTGDGNTFPASIPYQATDCDQVPYDPRLELTLSDYGPDQAPAISSTVSQAPLGEATTKQVEVRFPRNFKVNSKNTATHCPEELLAATDADADADHCPESSRIGTVTAESRLLPEGQKLHGNVYLAGLTGDSIKVAAFIRGQADPQRGFIDFQLRIDARGKLGDDLVLKTTFSDLPAVPITRFDLNLEGGEKGVIRTPKLCSPEPEQVVADFASHSGRVKTNTIPVRISGCRDPVLDVELSNPRKGKPTDLTATVGSTGTAIESVALRLDRHLKWGKRKARKGRRQLTRGGSATFDTLGGQKVVPLKAKATKRGSLVFGPLTTGRKGQRVETAIPGFSATLSRARAQAARTARRDLSAFFRKSALNMSGLPGDDPTAVELNLLGQNKNRPIYLKNPMGCKKPLNFVAIVKTKRGATLALKDRVRLKGKGCAKRRHAKRRNG